MCVCVYTYTLRCVYIHNIFMHTHTHTGEVKQGMQADLVLLDKTGQRTHSITREHIRYQENTLCIKRTHCTVSLDLVLLDTCPRDCACTPGRSFIIPGVNGAASGGLQNFGANYARAVARGHNSCNGNVFCVGAPFVSLDAGAVPPWRGTGRRGQDAGIVIQCGIIV